MTALRLCVLLGGAHPTAACPARRHLFLHRGALPQGQSVHAWIATEMSDVEKQPPGNDRQCGETFAKATHLIHSPAGHRFLTSERGDDPS